jgi:ribulose-bisphosphate carboxylase large chain
MGNDITFYADWEKLDQEKYLILDYYFESTIEPHEAAAHMCQEQSTAQWKRVGVDEDLRSEFASKVIDLQVERELKVPSIPFQIESWDKLWGVRVKIAYPIANFGPRIPNMLTAIGGEGAYYSPGIYTIKLHDIIFPDSYLDQFEGPKFGVKGLRKWTEVYDRPLFLGVIKPNIGLGPKPFGDLAYQSWMGGLDIAKDDELLCDTEWSPFAERTRVLGKLRAEAEQKTGKRSIYLANITDEVDRMIELHDIGVKNGADMLMINAMCTGLSGVRMVRKHTEVPLVAHFDFIAPFTKAPYYGVHSRVVTKLQRLSGCDMIIFPGLGSRMKTPEKEVFENVNACLNPMGPIKPTLPVPAGSQWAGSLGPLHKMMGHTDFAIVPGRAVFGHPGGPTSGAKSLQQGWDSVVKGVTLEEYAKDHLELAQAIEQFTGKEMEK